MKLEFEDERQAGAKAGQARAEVERALAGARQAMGIEAEDIEPPSAALSEEGTERRITFIIRLTVDERGQPRRTEIEHAQSGQKEILPDLDVQRLAAFMQKCISPQ
jgi:hypothetical protein